MTDIQDIPDRNSQVETLLNQMNERLQQLEQENNKMCAQNLQYQHQIETQANEQTLGSSRFRTKIRPMPSLDTPTETSLMMPAPFAHQTIIELNQVRENK